VSELFSDEGIDWLLSLAPRGTGTIPSTLYLGFFTSQTASTVPAGTAVLSTSTGVTEATGTAYVRQAIANTSWAGIVASTSPTGRKTTAAQVVFPAVGAGAWGTLNGFFIATAATAGIGIFYANFDDTTAIVTAVNDIVKITPTWISTP
jgi:hypothetical protein